MVYWDLYLYIEKISQMIEANTELVKLPPHLLPSSIGLFHLSKLLHIHTIASAKNPGATLDSVCSFTPCISSGNKVCWFYFQNLSQVYPLLSNYISNDFPQATPSLAL